MTKNSFFEMVQCCSLDDRALRCPICKNVKFFKFLFLPLNSSLGEKNCTQVRENIFPNEGVNFLW